jgi:hypothetical protein
MKSAKVQVLAALAMLPDACPTHGREYLAEWHGAPIPCCDQGRPAAGKLAALIALGRLAERTDREEEEIMGNNPNKGAGSTAAPPPAPAITSTNGQATPAGTAGKGPANGLYGPSR